MVRSALPLGSPHSCLGRVSPDQLAMPGVLGEAILRKEPRMDTSRTYVGIDVAKAKLDIASSPPGLTTSKSADPETPEVPGAAFQGGRLAGSLLG